jgi:ornithine carbamoyltransferase
MGALLGSDVRLCAPKSLWPADEVVAKAQQLAASSGARITLTEDVAEAVRGAQFVHTDVWVSMGESKETWTQRIELLTPYRVTAEVLALSGRDDVKFMHCLPALHDTNTTLGQTLAEQYGLTHGVEVSTDVFASERNIAFDQAENRMHTIEAVLVATLRA